MKVTVSRRVRFLESLAAGNTVVYSAAHIGVAPKTMYEHRKMDATFAAAWDEALELGVQVMEQEAYRRAVKGVSKPIASAGKVVANVQEYSDALMMFLLKAKRPEMYRDTVNIELYIRQEALKAGIDPDAAVAEAQTILKEAKATR